MTEELGYPYGVRRAGVGAGQRRRDVVNRRRNAAVVLGCFSAAQIAYAGPDWDEVSDAGSLPSSAQVVPPGVKTIRGMLSGAALDGAPDFEDMYRITITTPMVFCARTVPQGNALDCCGGDVTPAPPPGTNFNTQLWLFFAGGPSDGKGLLANDDQDSLTILSRLGNAANDGSGAIIVAPGNYYLAVTGGPGRDPVSAGGLIFNQVNTIEISGPDGPGGGAPIINWTGPPLPGSYVIVLCGTSQVAGIPTISEWGMIVMAGTMLIVGAWLINKRRRPSATTMIAS